MNPRNTFTQEEFEAFAPAEKIGLIVCTNPEGDLHVTLITSIIAKIMIQLKYCDWAFFVLTIFFNK